MIKIKKEMYIYLPFILFILITRSVKAMNFAIVLILILFPPFIQPKNKKKVTIFNVLLLLYILIGRIYK